MDIITYLLYMYYYIVDYMLIIKILHSWRAKYAILTKYDHLSWLTYSLENTYNLTWKFEMNCHYNRYYLQMIY